MGKAGGELENTGTYIRLGMSVANKYGICLEKYWPYDVSTWNKMPSFIAMQKATARKIRNYYSITETGDSRIEIIIQALRAKHPVVFGAEVSKEWQSYNGKYTLGPTTKNSLGGHAMVIVGHTPEKGFIIKNSWGSSWGEGGFGYVDYDFIKASRTQDIWVPTIGSDFK
jgi:C1A family cysteine protease